eukprot:728838-Pleurochrysis_carterae.AAC.1
MKGGWLDPAIGLHPSEVVEAQHVADAKWQRSWHLAEVTGNALATVEVVLHHRLLWRYCNEARQFGQMWCSCLSMTRTSLAYADLVVVWKYKAKFIDEFAWPLQTSPEGMRRTMLEPINLTGRVTPLGTLMRMLGFQCVIRGGGCDCCLPCVFADLLSPRKGGGGGGCG